MISSKVSLYWFKELVFYPVQPPKVPISVVRSVG